MENVPTPGMPTYRGLLALGASVPISALDAITAQPDGHDPINIQSTSGTTGAPKGGHPNALEHRQQ